MARASETLGRPGMWSRPVLGSRLEPELARGPRSVSSSPRHWPPPKPAPERSPLGTAAPPPGGRPGEWDTGVVPQQRRSGPGQHLRRRRRRGHGDPRPGRHHRRARAHRGHDRRGRIQPPDRRSLHLEGRNPSRGRARPRHSQQSASAEPPTSSWRAATRWWPRARPPGTTATSSSRAWARPSRTKAPSSPPLATRAT